MDISICSIQGQQLKFAGANNGLWVFKPNQAEPSLAELKADRQAVGWQEKLTAFSQEEITIEKGTTVYLLTDGFPDQFGGGKGKKLKKKPLKSFLVGIQTQSMMQQSISLDKKFENWRGDNEQIDDVCVMGIRF